MGQDIAELRPFFETAAGHVWNLVSAVMYTIETLQLGTSVMSGSKIS
jgi:hypothetical protein